MRIKSSVTVTLEVSADCERLADDTLIITRPQLCKEMGESAVDFECLPQYVRRVALEALSRDGKAFTDDMDTALGVRK